MSLFADDLTVTQLSGDERNAWRLWRLENPLVYKNGCAITVPAGFITDGPSIPRCLWALLPVWGRWSRAGVLHDYLCCLIAAGRPHAAAQTRDQADGIFRDAMTALGVSWPQLLALYVGVRMGTWFRVPTTMLSHNEKLRKCGSF